jgi:hypothetical protein
MNSVVKLVTRDVDSIPFQEASLDIWDKKYRLSSKQGEPIDGSMDDTYKRVALSPMSSARNCERFGTSDFSGPCVGERFLPAA